MKTAIIGHTGFVGKNIADQKLFDFKFNSSNINEIRGETFNLLVIAAPSAVKWKANQDPENDWKIISDLINILETISADQVILISTVDVYKTPINSDENTFINPDESQPYGKHRFLFEEFIRKHFTNHLIVRLPGLFGDGLKKNFIYDMLHDNCLDLIHKDSVFQFYSLDNIWKDITIAIDNNLPLINFATEPISVAEAALTCFGRKFENITEKPPVSYDMKSIHSRLYHGNSGYLYDKKTILSQLKGFIERYEAL